MKALTRYRGVVTIFGMIALAACGTSSPMAPQSGADGVVATGAQIFRMTIQNRCADASGDFLPMVYTAVTVAASGSEWVATASGAAAGDVELRFHQTSARTLGKSMEIAGTIRGTATHMPELIQAPAWNARANFGADGRTLLTGVAFAAGFLGSPMGGMDGLGTGSVVLNDSAGHSCSGTTFSWSLFPPQTP